LVFEVNMEEKKIVVSGIRATGKLHLGNYWGAMKNFIDLQDKYKCFYFIADWHALTTISENNISIYENSREIIVDWLSAGIDPEKCIIFRQSDVKEHSELHLILSMITPLNWLLRNPTFKEQLVELYQRKYKGQEEKMKKPQGLMEKIGGINDFNEQEAMAFNSEFTNYGFLGYPVLQTADILLYDASYVPVGQDQLPHLELAREIARRFNSFFNCKIFREPEPLLTQTPILPGLDGKKMSKSYGNTIDLDDIDDILLSKIKRMFTDPKKIRANDKGNPHGCVVFAMHKLYNPEFKKREKECMDGCIGCSKCKIDLFELMNPEMKKFKEKKDKIKNSDLPEKILKEGALKAGEVASKKMMLVNKEVKII